MSWFGDLVEARHIGQNCTYWLVSRILKVYKRFAFKVKKRSKDYSAFCIHRLLYFFVENFLRASERVKSKKQDGTDGFDAEDASSVPTVVTVAGQLE